MHKRSIPSRLSTWGSAPHRLQIRFNVLNVHELHLQAVGATAAVAEVHLSQAFSGDVTELPLARAGVRLTALDHFASLFPHPRPDDRTATVLRLLARVATTPPWPCSPPTATPALGGTAADTIRRTIPET